MGSANTVLPIQSMKKKEASAVLSVESIKNTSSHFKNAHANKDTIQSEVPARDVLKELSLTPTSKYAETFAE